MTQERPEHLNRSQIKYIDIAECLAVCYIQAKRILEDAELLDIYTKPIKEDRASFAQEFMQLCM